MGLTMRELRPEMPQTSRWFALSVRHQHEQQIGQLLKCKGWETLVPTYRTRRTWSDRTKELELPLFSGYVFCQFEAAEKLQVLNTPGISKIVGFAGAPAPVEESEIEELRRVVASGLPVHPWPYLKPGDKVRIERGPLRGVEGTLLRDKDGLRLIVGIELLQRSVAVELDPDTISPIRSMPARAVGSYTERIAV